jgi:hypothetical protein
MDFWVIWLPLFRSLERKDPGIIYFYYGLTFLLDILATDNCLFTLADALVTLLPLAAVLFLNPDYDYDLV